jgi:hypothetical protein
MKDKRCFVLVFVLFVCLVMAGTVLAQSKLYMQDTPSDVGLEPNPDTGPMWLSPDIWVRENAIPGYQPYPYSDRMVPPLWLSALGPNPDQFPRYRDPLLSKPNYVYVRVHNIGNEASTGAEQLHLYWAKASTGLSWPTQWVDYMANTCGPNILYGIEVTKPRRNFADMSVPQSEVDNYINAISNIATSATYTFPDGIQYWYKQNQVHFFVVALYNLDPGFVAHGSDGFLPWHREFINRYETLLRKAFPTVTLFYWDWTTNPMKTPQSTRFAAMGSFNGGIDPIFYNVLDPPGDAFGTYAVARHTGANPEKTSDAAILVQSSYSDFSAWDEGRDLGNVSQAHNISHPFIGGFDGNMSQLNYAAQDPFFFLLHGNADRLWSMWQRQNPADASSYDPASAYTGTMNDMTKPMTPWNGFEYNGVKGTIPSPTLRPWTTGDGYVTMKAANDPSVVFPPIYDTAPLTIPVLQPNESVVIQIPWYPPNPADFSCFGGDQGHVCLLARIETSASPPYGMTFPEGTAGNDLYTNVQNNARIAWRNVTVVPFNFGQLLYSQVLVRNFSQNNKSMQLGLTLSGNNAAITNFGQVLLDLGPNLYARWLANGSIAQGFQTNGTDTQLLLVGTNGLLSNLSLAPNEVDQVQVGLLLNDGYSNPQGQVFDVDLLQYDQGAVGQVSQLVGGQRFAFDFNRLSLVSQGSIWKYYLSNQLPGANWSQVGYDDSYWQSGEAKLGFGVGDEATVTDGGPSDDPHITTWFRYDFGLQDLNVYSNLWLQLKAYDGAVVYLNGLEIARLRMPAGTITPETLASTEVSGLAANAFYPLNVSGYLSLLAATNVVAVEVHRGSTNSDLGFDLQLDANLFAPNFPPQAAFLSPANGGLFLTGQPIPLTAEAVGFLNPIGSVSFYADGNLIGTSTTAPYNITWGNPGLGMHQLTAMATDIAGMTGSGFGSVQVMSNVPPEIAVTTPAEDQMFAPNAAIIFSANVQKIGGTIQKVDFFLMQHGPAISNPLVTLGTVTAPPYRVEFSAPSTGMYMLTAVATDNAGVRSYSVPVMILVVAVEPPSLSITNASNILILNWTPTNAVLERALSPTGPWQTVSNVFSPYGFIPGPAVPMSFFRVRLSSPLTPSADVICRKPVGK